MPSEHSAGQGLSLNPQVSYWMQNRQQMIRSISAAYEHAPDPVLLLDANFVVHYANPASKGVAGERSSELIGGVCYRVLFGKEGPCEGCRLPDAIARRAGVSRTQRSLLLNGKEKWLDQIWFPVADEDGAVEFVLDMARDVTELRTAYAALESARDASVALRHERNLARSYMEVSPIIIMRVGVDGRIDLLNRAGLDLIHKSEADVVGRNFRDFFPAEALGNLPFEDGEQLGSELIPKLGDVFTTEISKRVIEWRLAPVFEDGRHAAVVASGLDVTDQHAAVQDSRFRLKILDQANDGIVVHRDDGSVIYANERFLALVGMSFEELQSAPCFGWVAPEFQHEHSMNSMQVQTDGHAVFESGLIDRSGQITPVEIRASVLEWNGEYVIVATGRDISERKAAEATIERMAFYDTLTGLANRQLFNDRLHHAIGTSQRNEAWLGVIFLDLDHFKSVNDTLGHRFGDALLVKVADRLRGAVRQSDTVARLGGDEFTIIFEGISGALDAAALGAKVLRSLDRPFEIEGESFVITASAGISVTYAGEADADTLLQQADTAMYKAKEAGRKGFRLFEPEMRESAKTRFDLKNALPRALANEEFEVYFQPQFSVASGELTGAEALVRWNHPSGELLTPQQFLPAAEESGIINDLGVWVLHKSADAAAEWYRNGSEVPVAVNLSARQFEDPKLCRVLEGLLQETGLPPHLLELEITESVAMRDAVYLRTTFQRIRSLGIRLAIDDFGTGFSSLDQLMSLEVDTLKLDRRFVSDMLLDPRAAAISSAVIFLGNSLGMRVVAEGVEREEHLTFLAQNECKEAQGYLLGKPTPAADFAELLGRAKAAPVSPASDEKTRPLQSRI